MFWPHLYYFLAKKKKKKNRLSLLSPEISCANNEFQIFSVRMKLKVTSKPYNLSTYPSIESISGSTGRIPRSPICSWILVKSSMAIHIASITVPLVTENLTVMCTYAPLWWSSRGDICTWICDVGCKRIGVRVETWAAKAAEQWRLPEYEACE